MDALRSFAEHRGAELAAAHSYALDLVHRRSLPHAGDLPSNVLLTTLATVALAHVLLACLTQRGRKLVVDSVDTVLAVALIIILLGIVLGLPVGASFGSALSSCRRRQAKPPVRACSAVRAHTPRFISPSRALQPWSTCPARRPSICCTPCSRCPRWPPPRPPPAARSTFHDALCNTLNNFGAPLHCSAGAPGSAARSSAATSDQSGSAPNFCGGQYFQTARPSTLPSGSGPQMWES